MHSEAQVDWQLPSDAVDLLSAGSGSCPLPPDPS